MNVNKPVYLDYAATTPTDPAVLEAMLPFLGHEGGFANPASISHAAGRAARKVVEAARGQIAALVGAQTQEIIFTSGATESDNLALMGVMRHLGRQGAQLLTSRTEHKAVLDTAHALESEGFKVTRLVPDAQGRISVEALSEAINEDTVLVSIMLVNNEIGVIQDMAALGALCRERGVLFHVDAAQGAGKVPIDLAALPVDLMSFSGHKVYGPKGIGALYVRQAPEVRLDAMIHGGGHEGGLRSGTLATHQIVGMGRAFEVAGLRLQQDTAHSRALTDRLYAGLSGLGGVEINGPDGEHRVASILNLAFENVVSETLLYFLTDVSVSTSSACSSSSRAPSYVLKAIGCSDARARSSVRMSVGRFTTMDEVEVAIEHIGGAVNRLREMAPVTASA